jgi:hypothetical protein
MKSDFIKKSEIRDIAKDKNTIPLWKLDFDAFLYRKPTNKSQQWIDTYFERTKWELLDSEKFKSKVISFIIEKYNGDYILDYKCGESSCDIFLPDLKKGFKLLSLFEYSEINVNKKNQINTWNDFEKSGYHVIQIFEDSWNLKEDIVKNRIVNILGLSEKIYARKCEVRVLTDNKILKELINNSHIQGNVGSSIKLGLFNNDELVSVMTFGTLRKNLGQVGQSGYYEILRFCNKNGLNVVGGASKLFNYFLKLYNPTSVISYADKCWSSTQCLYTKLGMSKVHDSEPSYFYIVGTKRKGRFGFRKDVVLQVGFDGNYVGEHTGMLSMDIYRIFDCGTSKYEWVKTN